MIVKKDKHSTNSKKPLKVAFYIRPDYLEQMSPEFQKRYKNFVTDIVRKGENYDADSDRKKEKHISDTFAAGI